MDGVDRETAAYGTSTRVPGGPLSDADCPSSADLRTARAQREVVHAQDVGGADRRVGRLALSAKPAASWVPSALLKWLCSACGVPELGYER